ncbi:MAG: type II toxin-antitoxin system RelE/ParE family toxin [Chromatiales bacterium]|nr:type II toxin-antitoxin system RelE/ParE family toxin [Chromatiales bacterium]
MSQQDKPLVWLHGEVKTPPMSVAARVEAGFLLRRLQRGESLSMPQSRPMLNVGQRCHELRVRDADRNWRLMYRADPDAIVILDVWQKKTRATPRSVIDNCRRRLREYDHASRQEKAPHR